MRTIRSLLWIGSGRGLSESGVTEAPELDVTWVPHVDDACLLPRVHFDGILFEIQSADRAPGGLADLARYAPDTPVLLCLPESEAQQQEALLDAGAAALLFAEPIDRSPASSVRSTMRSTIFAEPVHHKRLRRQAPRSFRSNAQGPSPTRRPIPSMESQASR